MLQFIQQKIITLEWKCITILLMYEYEQPLLLLLILRTLAFGTFFTHILFTHI